MNKLNTLWNSVNSLPKGLKFDYYTTDKKEVEIIIKNRKWLFKNHNIAFTAMLSLSYLRLNKQYKIPTHNEAYNARKAFKQAEYKGKS